MKKLMIVLIGATSLTAIPVMGSSPSTDPPRAAKKQVTSVIDTGRKKKPSISSNSLKDDTLPTPSPIKPKSSTPNGSSKKSSVLDISTAKRAGYNCLFRSVAADNALALLDHWDYVEYLLRYFKNKIAKQDDILEKSREDSDSQPTVANTSIGVDAKQKVMLFRYLEGYFRIYPTTLVPENKQLATALGLNVDQETDIENFGLLYAIAHREKWEAQLSDEDAVGLLKSEYSDMQKHVTSVDKIMPANQ